MLEIWQKLPKKYLVIFVIIILLIIFGILNFRKTGKVEEIVSSPTPLGLTPVEISPTPTPSPTPKTSPTPTPTPSPTPKSTPTPTPVSTSKTLNSAAFLDGFQASNGGGNTGIEIRAGRNVNLIARGFVSFALSSIPSGAVIEKATLRLYQTSVTGDPYGVGASLKIDHLDYGSTFENADYSTSSISSSFATLTSNAVIEWKDADVSDQVKNDRSAGRSRSQYRLHFAIESIGGDILGDFAHFESADNSTGTGNTPQLVVKYH